MDYLNNKLINVMSYVNYSILENLSYFSVYLIK